MKEDEEKDLIALGDLAGITLRKVTGGTPESTKLKKKMLLGKKKESKEKLPEHIRKVYIVINDKSKNEPILVKFAGDWTVSDLNLAGKHLILEYNVYSRNRAISK